MFYSQFILAKKGPLGTIWIAAHLERKLRKNQVADTDIGVSVDSILFPDVPIALRLSSHLLLGVVRIYSRKVNYLFHDCSEALLKVKQAFRSTAVDLPPEESTAPYHSITLPETFDLDDFELPDSEIFLGNYVDHHVSAREQITLQDTMDGGVYSTSQFGLDERFGDGDTSQIVFDLDEDLFLDKVTTPGHTAVLLDSNDADPQASGHPVTPFTDMDIVEDENKSGEDCTAIGSYVMPIDATEEQIDSNLQHRKMADNSCPLSHSQIQAPDLNDKGFLCGHIEGSSADPSTDFVVCAQGPSTPGLVEEVVPANNRVQEVTTLILVDETSLTNSAEVILPDATSNHQLDSEYCDPTKFVAEESGRDLNNAGVSSLFNNNSSETDGPFMAKGENGPLLGGLQQEDSPSAVAVMSPISLDIACLVSSPTSVPAEQPKTTSLASECLDRTLGVSDNVDRAETSQNGVSSNGKSIPSFVDQIHAGVAPQGISSDATAASTLEEACIKPLPGVEGNVSVNSKLTTDCKPSPEVISESDCILPKETSEPQTCINVGHAGDFQESSSCYHAFSSSVDSFLGPAGAHEFEKIEAKTCLESEEKDTEIRNLAGPDEKPCSHSHVLRACNSLLNKPDVLSLGDGNLAVNVPDLSPRGAQPCTLEILGREEALHASGTLALVQGEECHPSSDRVRALEANQILESVPSGSVQADLSKSDDCLDTVISKDTRSENFICQECWDLPAPEVLLSAPVAAPDVPSDLLVEATPEKEVSAEREQSVDGLKTFPGKKHRLMESTPVLPDGNSTKLSGMSRRKRTLDSIPDDNDLLSSILVGRSSVFKMRPTPPLPEIAPSKRRRLTPRVSVPKRKVHLDDAMVLHGDTIRQQLISTEDIRRIRRKAPCTRPEIWMIEKHLLEDEIFSEPLLTGMSADLIGLHNHTHDLMETRVSKIDANDTLSEVSKKMEPSRNIDLIIETSVEASVEPVVVGNDGETHQPDKTLEQTENQSCEKHSINYIGCDTKEQEESVIGNPPLDLPKDGQLEEASAMEINHQDNGVTDIADNAATLTAELPVLTGPLFGDKCNVSVGSMIESSPMGDCNGAEMTLQNDDNFDTHSIEKGAFIEDTTMYAGGVPINVEQVEEEGLVRAEGVSKDRNGSVIEEIGSGGSVDVMPQERQDVDEGLSSTMIVPMLDNCSVENGADVPLDASIHMENVEPSLTNVSVGSHELTDLSIVFEDHTKEGIGSEVGVVIMDEILAEKVKDDEGDSSSKLIFSEEPLREHSCPLELSAGAENVHLHVENLNCQEANLGKTMDVENTALDIASAKDSGDFGNTIDGIDTEFLNFDDEEVFEEEEDNGMPNAEEARFLDNSGWSSRTRAVARYLQTFFDNESGHGRKSLPMENLLSGKTRKEASRMFFETLVLKTRDYIHVEQEKSFDNINIKPRAKLMKSDF